METKFTILSNGLDNTKVYCISGNDISVNYINQVIESNKAYFELIQNKKIGVRTIKFEQVNNQIIMRTFSEQGFEAATYTVKDDFELTLYKETERNNELYSKNGLRVVPYDETFDGDMIYRMLDKRDLDPVGDGFQLHEAIDFADNYPAWKSEGY